MQIMREIKVISIVALSLIILLSNDLSGQCKTRFIMDIGGGRTITSRIKVPYRVDDCEKVFKKVEPPIFIFDSSFSADNIVNTEKDYYRNERCKYLRSIPDYDTCLKKLLEGDDRELIKSVQNLICFYDGHDTIFDLIHERLKETKNERTKAFIARDLKLSNNPNAKSMLFEISQDTCEYVRLEVGRSLSWLGVKEESFKILKELWDMNVYPINLDRFDYFTSSMRNINTPAAEKFLLTLSEDTNQYCALDASICLMQIGKRDECVGAIKKLITTDDPIIFKSLSRALYKYYPTSFLIDLLENMVKPKNEDIVLFRRCILNKYGVKNENIYNE